MVKKLTIFFVLAGVIVYAQTSFPPGNPIYLVGTGVPAINCQTGRLYARTDSPKIYLCSAPNTWTDTSGSGSAVPSGSILAILSGTCPPTYTELTSLDGTFLFATTVANGNVGTTGGSNSVTPTGTVTAPTFTGNSVNTSLITAGTPAGTNATGTVTATGTINTPTITWPVGVPTNSNESSHTHSVTATGTNATGTVTATGTINTPVISWPAGVPTQSGTTAIFTGSALATHAHELPWQIPSTTTIRQIAIATFGTGTSRTATAVSAAGTANTTSAAVALSEAKSAGTPAGTNAVTDGAIAWPAGVPTSTSLTFTGSSATTSAQTFTGSAATSGAGSAHTHTVSWPAGVPTNSALIFTGTSATTSAQVFTGTALGTHQHTVTATGTNSIPTFSGASQDNRPAFTRVIYCQKS